MVASSGLTRTVSPWALGPAGLLPIASLPVLWLSMASILITAGWMDSVECPKKFDGVEGLNPMRMNAESG
jgi:hypothetical protein